MIFWFSVGLMGVAGRMVTASCRQLADSLQVGAFVLEGEQGFGYEEYELTLPPEGQEFQRVQSSFSHTPETLVNITTAAGEKHFVYAGPPLPMFQAFFKPTAKQVVAKVVKQIGTYRQLARQGRESEYFLRFEDKRLQMIFSIYGKSLLEDMSLAINFQESRLALFTGQLEMDTYDLVTQEWSKVNASGTPPPAAPASTHTHDRTLYLVPESAGSVYLLDLDSLVWTERPVEGLNGTGHGCLYLYNGMLIHGLGTKNVTQLIDIDRWALARPAIGEEGSKHIISEPVAIAAIALSSLIAFIVIGLILYRAIKYRSAD